MERDVLKVQDASRSRVGVMIRKELVIKPLGKIISVIVPLLVLCTWWVALTVRAGGTL